MGYLSEDPTLLAGGLLLAAGAFVVAMRATQQGKYLVRAVIAAAMAAAVVAVEWLWVTDNERIEQVVYALRDAVADSDADGVLRHLAPDVMYVKGDVALEGEATRALVRDNLSRVRFEVVRITHLETNVAPQSRRGTATFGVFFKGTADGSMNVGSVNSSWSLGLGETEPGAWKVNRITPVQVPGDGLHVPGGRGRAR
jgi:ketosteroid isomerase-like protein